ncbi:hypothetical protein BD289DRAFT_454336 [Coniella lustricola]|uniref:Uncharacterized protein n=1 Tax=Coniella lustricola TaxID=2025994 RepID=A0A2T3A412_9PEZI|nr:hypothetical protein BD289DRAFT_454336 [Coniella lustricola]
MSLNSAPTPEELLQQQRGATRQQIIRDHPHLGPILFPDYDPTTYRPTPGQNLGSNDVLNTAMTELMAGHYSELGAMAVATNATATGDTLQGGGGSDGNRSRDLLGNRVSPLPTPIRMAIHKGANKEEVRELYEILAKQAQAQAAEAHKAQQSLAQAQHGGHGGGHGTLPSFPILDEETLARAVPARNDPPLPPPHDPSAFPAGIHSGQTHYMGMRLVAVDQPKRNKAKRQAAANHDHHLLPRRMVVQGPSAWEQRQVQRLAMLGYNAFQPGGCSGYGAGRGSSKTLKISGVAADGEVTVTKGGDMETRKRKIEEAVVDEYTRTMVCDPAKGLQLHKHYFVGGAGPGPGPGADGQASKKQKKKED